METRPTSLVEDTIAIESSSPVSNQLQATPSEAEVDAQLTQTTDVDGGGSHSVAPPLADANLDLSVIGTVVEPGPGALLLLPTHEPMSPISDLKLTTKAVPVGLTHPTAYMQDAQRGATGSSALATSDAAMAVAQPNYPPVIYPPVPVAALADSDRMQVDVQEDEMVGEDDEDMVDEEDASSEISEGEDLKGDLELALQGDFNFRGEYAFATTLPQAPNPGLHIDGLGLVGMPLSERDAKLIEGCASQAPFGRGKETIVDTEVRDTFEIEPARVSFRNLVWDAFVQDLVIKSIWPTLGAGPCPAQPRCSLYKLLLYKQGSHFLPHQDTEKEPGMFATIIILLPSLFSGGQVHVGHGTTNKIFDLASCSAFTTSLLAWYTDVMHEVKPITSGYRLALSYNLVHTTPGIPRPTLSTEHSAVSTLRHILRKWAQDAYAGSDGDTSIVAYLLQHKYSHVNLNRGALKGVDAHLVSNLRQIAQEEGIAVCLASLELTITGEADDCGGGYYKRNRRSGWGRGYSSSEDEDDDVPGMAEETDRTLTVNHVVDLDGIPIMGDRSLNIEEEHIIPENSFENAEPDDSQYEGYMGNGAGSLEHFYRRTVLVLFPRQEESNILLNAGGVSYAVQKLRAAGARAPTAEDRKFANYVLSQAGTREKITANFMADLALRWGDSGMWRQVVKASGADKNIGVLGRDKFIGAWKRFSFEVVRSSFEEILTQGISLKSRLDLINSLPIHAAEAEHDLIRDWCSSQTTRALSSLKNPVKEDVPILMDVVRSKGIKFLSESILPQFMTTTFIYDFWLEFILALNRNKSALLQMDVASTLANETVEVAFNKVMQRCLAAAVTHWDSGVAQPRPYSYYGNPMIVPTTSRIARIVQLAELCLSSGHRKNCEYLFTLVFKSQGDLATKYKTLYIPMIPELRSMLTRTATDITSYPFGEFFRLIIGTYFQHILGAKPRLTRAPNLRNIGCGCVDCGTINTFLRNSTHHQQLFRLVKNRRIHLEAQLQKAPDLVSFTTIRTGSLQVAKSKDIVAQSQWLARQNDARLFLTAFGNGADIGNIMGGQYADLMRALDGTLPYKMPAVVANSAPQGGSLGGITPSNVAPSIAKTKTLAAVGPPVNPPQLPTPSGSSTAGHKRKKTPQVDGDVIDLTCDSP